MRCADTSCQQIGAVNSRGNARSDILMSDDGSGQPDLSGGTHARSVTRRAGGAKLTLVPSTDKPLAGALTPSERHHADDSMASNAATVNESDAHPASTHAPAYRDLVVALMRMSIAPMMAPIHFTRFSKWRRPATVSPRPAPRDATTTAHLGLCASDLQLRIARRTQEGGLRS